MHGDVCKSRFNTKDNTHERSFSSTGSLLIILIILLSMPSLNTHFLHSECIQFISVLVRCFTRSRFFISSFALYEKYNCIYVYTREFQTRSIKELLPILNATCFGSSFSPKTIEWPRYVDETNPFTQGNRKILKIKNIMHY